MKQKKFCYILLLIAICLIKNVRAEDIDLKNGFVQENRYTYYYKNGIIQKGIIQENGNCYFLGEYTGRLQYGWITSSLTGKQYYADSTGILSKGFKIINQDTYFFDENNILKRGIIKYENELYFMGEYTGKLQYGWITSSLNGNKYYANEKGKLIVNFQKIGEDTYYFNSDGVLQLGIKMIAGKYYFLGEYTGKVQNGYVKSSITQKEYYVSDSGEILTGIFEINHNKYYFTDKGKMFGLQKIDGKGYFFGEYTGKLQYGLIVSSKTNKIYYANNNGELQSGPTAVNKERYYFSKTNWEALKGFIKENNNISYYAKEDYRLVEGKIKIKGIDYLFTESGILYNNFVSFEDGTYYFINGFKQTGITKIDGTEYFLGEYTGKVQVGFVTSITGNRYYTDESGIIQKGIVTINGEEYFLGENTGKIQVGLIKSSNTGDYYYADENGKIFKGNFQIGEQDYSAFETGVLKNGFIKENNYTYYYEKGRLTKGIYQVDNNLYFFGEYTGRLQYGWIISSLTNDKYYSDNGGVILKGLNRINDKLYFFGEYTGKLQYGWVHSLNGSIYYSNNEGEIQIGNQFIDGRSYLFDSDGKIETGFQKIGEETYYIDENGKRLTGVQKIHGIRYRFNSDGVMTDSNFKLIADISYYQGTIDWDSLWNSKEIDGVILRLGYSSIQDSKFEEYLSNVKRLNIPYSIYLFSYASDPQEAVFEANFTLEKIRQYNINVSLPIYYDIEGWKYLDGSKNSNSISKETYEQIVNNYISILNQASITAKVYTGLYYARDRLTENTKSQVDWIAHYTTGNCGYKEPHSGWQLTNSGTLPGIKGKVDLSIFYF